MNEPKISVIVPVYNGQEYLSASLDSLIASTYKNLEIILVDNGSTDRSGRICEEYAALDNRIAVLHTESNVGVSAARNMGLEIATGEWIGFFDSDDKIEPDMYEYLIHSAEVTDADIIQCGVFREYPDRTELASCPEKPMTVCSADEMNEGFWQHFAYTVWSKLYKSEIMKDLRFDTEYIIGEDLRYNLCALIKSRKTVLLPLPKYHYLQRAGSACYSAPTVQNVTSVKNMLKKSLDDFGKIKTFADFIFAEGMRNNAHVCSRIVLSGAKGFEDFISEIRKEIRQNFSTLRKCGGISSKEKAKLTLIAYFFGIYRLLLKVVK